jgi:hypothetical protein
VSTLSKEQLEQRAKSIDAAYANIVIPPIALEDLRIGAFYYTTTVERDHHGRVDEAATVRNEGARTFLVALEKRIERAKRRNDPAPMTAVSATAEAR